MLDFNAYLEEKKKKEVVKINPKKEDLYEKDAKGEDCTGSDHTKSEKKRRKEDVNDGPDVQNEQSLKPADRFKRDAGAIAKKKLRNKEHKKYVNFLDVDEAKVYTGPDKADRKQIKKMDNPEYAKKLADYEKNMDPKKRQALRDKATKGMKFTHEGRLSGANDMQSKLYAANNKSGKKMTDDEIKQEKGGKEFLDRLKAAKSKMKNEGVADRARKAVDHQRKGTHGDDHELDTEMKKTQKSVDKLNKVGERLRADTAAKKLEKKVKSGKMSEESAPMGKSDGKPANTNEEHAYDSAEESTKEIQKEISEKTFNALKDTLVDNAFSIYEATRYKKEKGYDKGGTRKPAPKAKDAKPSALDLVKKSIEAKYGKGAIMKTGGSKQQKKVKGQKDTRGTGKYKKAADAKKQTAADAKKRGFKSTQNYVDTMARYGGKDNYDKGKGLGT